MGLFDTLNDEVKIGTSRHDDKEGVYWQRIDRVELKDARSGSQYIKIHKTTVRVVNDAEGQAQDVGEETTQALFRDKFNYLERDLRNICRVGFNMTDTEADELSLADMQGPLIEENRLEGEVIEVSVKILVTKEEKTFPKIKWVRNVPAEELQAKLSDGVKAQFFPNGWE